MKVLQTVILMVALAFVTSTAGGKEVYPNGPVKIISPFPAGTSPDLAARSLARSLTEQLGNNFVVENRPTPLFSTLTVRDRLKASADGYELFYWHDGQMVIAPAVFEAAQPRRELGFDPIHDFVSLGTFSQIRFVLLANKQLNIRSVANLYAYEKTHPGKLTIGASGPSAILLAALLKAETGIDMPLVRNVVGGDDRALQDVVAGQLSLIMPTTTAAIVASEAGYLSLVGGAGEERNPFFPELPTLAEQGLKGFNNVPISWGGLFCPKYCPPEVQHVLREAVKKATTDSKIAESMAKIGLEVHYTSPEELPAVMKRDSKILVDILVSTGTKILD